MRVKRAYSTIGYRGPSRRLLYLSLFFRVIIGQEALFMLCSTIVPGERPLIEPSYRPNSVDGLTARMYVVL